MRRLLDEAGASHVKIFGGGGGTILPDEADELERTGIERIYTPDDGSDLGLQGMIDDLLDARLLRLIDVGAPDPASLSVATPSLLGRMISVVEQETDGGVARGTARPQRPHWPRRSSE